jgi:P-type Cu+ transporter
MGLAVPTAVMVATGRGASAGVLIKGGEPIERLASVDTVVLDKTGTLTEGKSRVTAFVTDPAEGGTATTPPVPVRDAVLSVERLSEHPLAKALADYAAVHGATARETHNFKAIAGRGARAQIDGHDVVIGTEALLRESAIDVSRLRATAEEWAAHGQTPVFVAIDGQPVAAVAVADTLRATAPEVVRWLRDHGIRTVMLTGDRKQTADAIARQAGIDEVIAEVLPDGKVAAIRVLQQQGRRIAMVGDGLNDAPALAQADVGIAMAAGTDIAAEAADVSLMRNDLAGLRQALTLAWRTMAVMKQNLFWAFIYNIVGIPIAAGVLYPAFGLLLNPVIASAAMAFSSVSVVTNSLRLRRVRLV